MKPSNSGISKKTIEHGWSRNVLVHQINTGLYQQQGKAITNFQSTLLSLQSDLAHNTIKDPYVFDFITTDEDTKERHLQIYAVYTEHEREDTNSDSEGHFKTSSTRMVLR